MPEPTELPAAGTNRSHPDPTEPASIDPYGMSADRLGPFSLEELPSGAISFEALDAELGPQLRAMLSQGPDPDPIDPVLIIGSPRRVRRWPLLLLVTIVVLAVGVVSVMWLRPQHHSRTQSGPDLGLPSTGQTLPDDGIYLTRTQTACQVPEPAAWTQALTPWPTATGLQLAVGGDGSSYATVDQANNLWWNETGHPRTLIARRAQVSTTNGTWVVYTSAVAGRLPDLYLWRAGHGSIKLANGNQLTTASFLVSPAISDTAIAWIDSGAHDKTTLHLRQLTTGATTSLPLNSSTFDQVQVIGSTAWVSMGQNNYTQITRLDPTGHHTTTATLPSTDMATSNGTATVQIQGLGLSAPMHLVVDQAGHRLTLTLPANLDVVGAPTILGPLVTLGTGTGGVMNRALVLDLRAGSYAWLNGTTRTTPTLTHGTTGPWLTLLTLHGTTLQSAATQTSTLPPLHTCTTHK